MVSIQNIQELVTGRISFSEPLSRFTTFRVGGPADIYIEPATEEEICKLVSYFEDQKFPYIVLGNGSNVLISDEGIRGAVINLERSFGYMEINDDSVTAGAGILLSRFVDQCVQHGLQGVEMLAGIPGTLGGAIRVNAGAYGSEISDHLVEIKVVKNGKIAVMPREEGEFAYRSSALQTVIILEARFHFSPADPVVLRERRKELLLKRNMSQPTNVPSAGSIFKNPSGDFAARLIESCGLKGVSEGGAVVSEKHANFIVNIGDATARDILSLILKVQSTVFEQTGVFLEPEIQFIGFPGEEIRGLVNPPESPQGVTP
ncbi:MAG: UDP-N-acetylmuramate dehydrogenase [Chlorobi bacterium]|nr:UDP-N-acetylmuramate dehydrogenase [Chlorobiota bacterium]